MWMRTLIALALSNGNWDFLSFIYCIWEFTHKKPFNYLKANLLTFDLTEQRNTLAENVNWLIKIVELFNVIQSNEVTAWIWWKLMTSDACARLSVWNMLNNDHILWNEKISLGFEEIWYFYVIWKVQAVLCLLWSTWVFELVFWCRVLFVCSRDDWKRVKFDSKY